MRLKDWRHLLRASFRIRPHTHVAPGIYPYMRVGGALSRFHLRVDADGSGLLLANAAAAVRLHPTGVVIAKGLLEGNADEAIAKRLTSIFRGVDRATAHADIAAVRLFLERLENPLRRFPVLNLVDPAFSHDIAEPAQPLLADVSLASVGRLRPILERLWHIGIPHVAFVLGALSSPEDLVQCVERAEDIGMITGVRGCGTALDDRALIDRLAIAGLDYLALGCASIDPVVHDRLFGENDHGSLLHAIELLLARDVCPVGVMPLVRDNLPTLEATLAGMSERGLQDVVLFAVAAPDGCDAGGALSGGEVVAVAGRVEHAAEALGMRLIWCPTVQFAAAIGLVEQVRRGPRTSGDLSVLVEPDGTVVLPRGPYCEAGNVLDDDWQAIAKSRAFAAYREMLLKDTHCGDCPGLAICAADCPRHACGWAAPAESGENAWCEKEL